MHGKLVANCQLTRLTGSFSGLSGSLMMQSLCFGLLLSWPACFPRCCLCFAVSACLSMLPSPACSHNTYRLSSLLVSLGSLCAPGPLTLVKLFGSLKMIRIWSILCAVEQLVPSSRTDSCSLVDPPLALASFSFSTRWSQHPYDGHWAWFLSSNPTSGLCVSTLSLF